MSQPTLDWEKIIEWDKKYIWHMVYTAQEYKPFPIAKTEGHYIIDAQGNKILDFMSQLICVNVGQRHPKVIQAIKNALDEFGYVDEVFVTKYKSELAKIIMEDILGSENWPGKCRFLTTGSEATEKALQVVKLYTDRPNIVARDYSYHGWTEGASNVTRTRRARTILTRGDGKTREMPGKDKGGYFFIPAAHCYRCPIGHTYPECKDKSGKISCILAAEFMLKELGPETVAGIIVEGVPGVGSYVPPDEYLPQLRKITQDMNVPLILDEVMSGFGRTGKWFAYQHWGIEPDIVTVAKGISSSQIPCSGLIISKKIGNFLDEWRDMVVSTFAAHPISVAAALANIKVIMEEKLVENAAKMGEYLLNGLRRLQEKHKCVGNVSGIGLFAQVELVKNRETKEVWFKGDRHDTWPIEDLTKVPVNIIQLKALEKGVLTAGWAPQTLRIGPSLTITEAEIDKFLDALDYGLTEVDKMCD